MDCKVYLCQCSCYQYEQQYEVVVLDIYCVIQCVKYDWQDEVIQVIDYVDYVVYCIYVFGVVYWNMFVDRGFV